MAYNEELIEFVKLEDYDTLLKLFLDSKPKMPALKKVPTPYIFQFKAYKK